MPKNSPQTCYIIMLNVLTVLPWIFLEIIPNRTQAVPIFLYFPISGLRGGVLKKTFSQNYEKSTRMRDHRIQYPGRSHTYGDDNTTQI